MAIITRKLKLYPNKNKSEILTDISCRQTDCVNFWVDKIREDQSTRLGDLQKKYYFEAREKFKTGGAITQLAMFVAIRIARISKKRRVNAPHLTQKSIATSFATIENNNIGFTFGIGGRVWIPFKSQIIPEGKIKESKVKKVGKDWYCFLAVDTGDIKERKTKSVIGVDLGLSKIAAISDEKGRHNKFFRGESYANKRSHYYNLRKKLQPKVKQGNVYKLLKRISRKESNWIRTENHRISRKIVNIAIENKSSIALENLTGITERLNVNKKTRRMLKSWSFRQLADFIKYKAHLAGLHCVSVDPRETSKMCSRCGYVSRSNRKSQSRFKCNNCGYETNADRNGAINIAKRAIGLSARR